jgi:hypothetical protein
LESTGRGTAPSGTTTLTLRVATAPAPRGSVTRTPTLRTPALGKLWTASGFVPPSSSYAPSPSKSNAYRSASPSGSLDPLASKRAAAPTTAPASAARAATGAAFGRWRATYDDRPYVPAV